MRGRQGKRKLGVGRGAKDAEVACLSEYQREILGRALWAYWHQVAAVQQFGWKMIQETIDEVREKLL